MKFAALTFLIIVCSLSCHTGRKTTRHAGNKSNTATTDTQKKTNITTDSIPPPVGLRTDSVIYIADTTAEAIMKGLYYSTDSTGDGITVKSDYPEDILGFTGGDTAYMSMLNHITYREHDTLVYFAVLYGACGYAMSNHSLYAFAFVFLHLTPQGWLVKKVQLGNMLDLEENSLSFLADGSLIFREQTVHVPNGGNLWVNNFLSYVHNDTVICLYDTLGEWANGAAGCADHVPCDCYHGEIEVQITRAKGAPYFIITENCSKTIFSKKNCAETGKVRSVNIIANINGDQVLLGAKTKGKTKVFVKNTPADILKAFKKREASSKKKTPPE
jgi:hypothetical protein